jgi:5'(3')-deoxyribonucleotidase
MSQSQPVVLLDCDGVLADFVTATLDVVAEIMGEPVAAERITTWEIFDSIGDEALRRRVYGIMNEPGFSESRIQAYPGAREAVGVLQERAELYVVTSPFHSAAWMHGRLAWLDRELAIPPGRVIFAREKHIVRGDVFVDDNPAHVREWNARRRGCTGRGMLFDQPYNRGDRDLPRVFTLAQIADLVDG